MEVFGPIVLCAAVIAVVAVAYLAVTSLRDRSRERREERSAATTRGRRSEPPRSGSRP